jgi:MFS family permease
MSADREKLMRRGEGVSAHGLRAGRPSERRYPQFVLPQRAAFWLLGAVMGLLLFAAAAPSPMYVIYQARWHFSATTLTIVFAVYAVAVLAALVAFGSLSDHLGRRPVLVGALVGQIAAMAVFADASGTSWLYSARIVQGLATGVASGAISAALIDLAPSERPALGPLVNTISLSGGLAAGALGSSALVQFAPAPTVLTYVLLLGVFALAIAGGLVIPEPVSTTWKGWRHVLRPRRAAVPAPIRRPFALASTGLVAAFAISGFYLSLGPSLTAGLLRSRSHLVGGLAIFVLFGAGATAQLTVRHWSARRAVLAGALATILGFALTDYAVSGPSTLAFFVGGAALGTGFGLSLMGAFRTLVSLASPKRRAEVTSAVYVVIYLSLGIPAVLAGLGATYLGLHVTTLIFSAVIGALAVLAAIGSMTQLPVRAAHGSLHDR